MTCEVTRVYHVYKYCLCFYLWWKENLVKHWKVWKYYETDCTFLYFCEICWFWNLWSHHRHCFIMKVTLMYQNNIWSKCLVCLWKAFLPCFWLNTEHWKLVSGPFPVVVQKMYSKMNPFLWCHKFGKLWYG